MLHIATDVEEKKVQDIKAAARRLKLDVRSTEAVEALAKDVAENFGALDILVNCAGYVHQGTVLEAGLGGLQGSEGRREGDRASIAIDAHDQLEAPLL